MAPADVRIRRMRFLSSALLACLLAACGTTGSSQPVAAGYYRVKSGDTLYRIAVNHGRSVGELTRWNGLGDASRIETGQVLRVSPPTGASRPSGGTASKPSTTKPAPNPSRIPPPAEPAPASGISLAWPAKGQLVGRFDGSSNKGIDIAGAAGDPVYAAAAGKVVYVGRGIRSYGNLLIIKHNNDYISAYAHNQTLIAREGQSVRKGQKIATMGDTASNRVKLHFELRLRGKAVDPLPYLD